MQPPDTRKTALGKEKSAGRGESVCIGYQQGPAEDKSRLVKRHFDSISSKYDFMNTLLSFGLHYLWKKTAVRMLGLCPADRAIDVCGGTADLSILAAKKVGPQGRVVLYDFSRSMINGGRKKVRKAGTADRIGYIQGDAEEISCASGRFDAVMVGFGIRNLADLKKGLAEMHRVLKPGGKLMCLEFSMPPSGLFRRLYDFYSFSIMPWVGKIFAGIREAYAYLPESIRKFPLAEELSAVLREIGFVEVAYRRLTLGIAVIHIGRKRS